ncbi:hypothetical protein TNCT_236621 [Trichonephila clavata]|uniref:Uncharacterized protein n=1 Tax=Trichonephila clavata TaxID=2740835 RepID=A0A8X6I204_TRICU|nr:hypothetical protein TNCT_236621 [Trichonephila clavata]
MDVEDIKSEIKKQEEEVYFMLMNPNQLCPGNDLVPSNINVDTIVTNSRFLILSQINKEMCRKSSFGVQKALKGIGKDLKAVKKF